MLVPKVADTDSFYHLGHAAWYLRHGPFDTSFPWTAFSVVSTQGADMWWGFHLLLMPFSLLGSIPLGISVAGMFVSAALLLGILYLADRHGFVAAGLWPAFFFVAVPNVLYRYVMVRPEVLSLLMGLLLVSALTRRRTWMAGLTAAGVTFFHLSMFWFPLGIVGAYTLGRGFDRLAVGPSEEDGLRTWLMPVAVVVAGTLAGWLLRPHPFAAARLAWVQIGLLLSVKSQGGEAPLTFAVSLAALPWRTLLETAGPMVVAWVGAVALALAAFLRPARLRAVAPTERHFLWTTHLIAGAFFVMTLVVARRSLVQWEAFGVLGLAASLTWLAGSVERRRVVAAVAVALVALLPWSVYRHSLNVRYLAAEPDHLAATAHWLADHSQPGDVVFNTHWDQFGPLFARDTVNHFLGGMDPIFQYAYDPELYWRFHYLSTDQMAERTCSDYPCTPQDTVDTWSTLTHDFRARWVLVEPRRNPRLSLYLLNDPRYALAFETQHTAVFQVLAEAPAVTPAP